MFVYKNNSEMTVAVVEEDEKNSNIVYAAVFETLFSRDADGAIRPEVLFRDLTMYGNPDCNPGDPEQFRAALHGDVEWDETFRDTYVGREDIAEMVAHAAPSSTDAELEEMTEILLGVYAKEIKPNYWKDYYGFGKVVRSQRCI